MLRPGASAWPSRSHLVALRPGRAPAITPAFGTRLPPDTIWAAGAALRMKGESVSVDSLNYGIHVEALWPIGDGREVVLLGVEYADDG